MHPKKAGSMIMEYRKMAGTSAVFVLAHRHFDAPVDREGMIWNDEELHTNTLPNKLNHKPALSTNLAPEGLEEYDPPCHGDLREVVSLDAHFAYIDSIKGWVELPN